MPSINKLESDFSLVRNLIDADAEASAQTVWGRTSDFWKGIFSERANFPSVSDFLGFRRADFGYGMADERQGELAKEEEHNRRTVEIFRQSVKPSRVTALEEDAFGAPYVFPSHGALRSAAFWTNAATALRIHDIFKQRAPATRALSVLEIGAGWGSACSLLQQLLDVDSYTIVDLPENLLLSTNYIAATSSKALVPISVAGPNIEKIPSGSLAFGLPGCLPRIEQKFDLIINSFSLQEMELPTVQAYHNWIANRLSPSGMFISFNSHGKAGVSKPAEYLSSGLRLSSLGMFRNFPTGLLNTIPYEMVFLADDGSTALDPGTMNTLGCLIQFGLGDNLQPVCQDFVTNQMKHDVLLALRDLRGFFCSTASTRKAALTSRTHQTLPAVATYLKAMDAFVCGDFPTATTDFETSIKQGLKGFAKLRACAHIALIENRQDLRDWNEDFDALLAYPELRNTLRSSDFGPFKIQFERIVSVGLQ